MKANLGSSSCRRPALFRSVCKASSRITASSQEAPLGGTDVKASRRQALLSSFAAATAAFASPELIMLANPGRAAAVFTPAPQGFRLQNDKLDGYSFIYPETWLAVTSSGNDVFVRNQRNIEENLFVDISSPSSSRYNSVEDLGSPEASAKILLDQYLTKEFMSTRIGITREGSVVSATARTGADGRKYYDIVIRITSYGSRSPYGGCDTTAACECSWAWCMQMGYVFFDGV